MNESSKEKLQMLLISLQNEADPVAAKLEEYNKEIFRRKQEIEKLCNQFSEDEFVFSPRANRSQSDEIAEKKIDLELLQVDYKDLQDHYNQINQNIDTVVDVLSSDNEKKINLSSLSYQEQDRQRIARDLHSTTLQNLSYLIDKLDKCSGYMDSDPVKAKMELSIAKKNLKDSIDEIRSIIYDLRPMIIDVANFRSVLHKLINNIFGEGDYYIEAEIDDIRCDNQLVLISIYRIIEECFLNIKKHAEAYKISFIFQEQMGYYYIYIEDDGKGFNPSEVQISDELHFGLNIVKERINILGGNFSLDSSNNAGTVIKILIPMA